MDKEEVQDMIDLIKKYLKDGEPWQAFHFLCRYENDIRKFFDEEYKKMRNSAFDALGFNFAVYK